MKLPSQESLTWFAVFLMVASCPGVSMAWSGGGHSIVAYIAESHLSPQARRHVLELLKVEHYDSLSDIANWADAMRSLKIPKQPSHALRLPLDNSMYDHDRDCRDDMCATSAIQADIDCLRDPKATMAAQLTALKYLVHLVGDLHQPLHTSKDTGQRKVFFNGQEMSLHQVWDGGIIRSLKIGNHKLAAMVDHNIPDAAVDLNPIHWAYEGRDIARSEIYSELWNFPQKNGIVLLPDDYTDRHFSTIEKRLKFAGLRLAEVLNEIYSNDDVTGGRIEPSEN